MLMEADFLEKKNKWIKEIKRERERAVVSIWMLNFLERFNSKWTKKTLFTLYRRKKTNRNKREKKNDLKKDTK